MSSPSAAWRAETSTAYVFGFFAMMSPEVSRLSISLYREDRPIPRLFESPSLLGMVTIPSFSLARKWDMAIAGAFAGLAGGIVALGSFKYGRIISGMDNYGFDGIAVALVGNCTGVGTMVAGYLFGLLKNAQALMQSKQIPKEITYIIQGLIVVFIALRSGLKLLEERLEKKRLAKEVTAQ